MEDTPGISQPQPHQADLAQAQALLESHHEALNQKGAGRGNFKILGQESGCHKCYEMHWPFPDRNFSGAGAQGQSFQTLAGEKMVLLRALTLHRTLRGKILLVERSTLPSTGNMTNSSTRSTRFKKSSDQLSFPHNNHDS